MIEFRIGVSIASVIPPFTNVAGQAFPMLSQAVAHAAQQGLTNWVAYAQGAPLPDGKRVNTRTGAYARSITTRQLNDLTAEIFTDLPYAHALEDGTPARDLHDMLGRSLKVRVSKAGRRYLIIPFRTYGANSVIGAPMPAAIEQWWRSSVPRESSSRVTSMGWRKSGTGAVAWRDFKGARFKGTKGEVVDVRARGYRWGQRLDAKTIRSLGLGEEAVKRHAGMVRFDKGTSGKHNQFLSFRVLAEGSPGWRVPARPGLHIAATVAQQLRPVAEEVFKKAAEMDIRRMLGDGQ